MKPVIVFSCPNCRDSQVLKAWLWEWNLPWVEQLCKDGTAVGAPKLRTVVRGKSFRGSFAEQREHLTKHFGLKRPVLYD